MEAGRDCPIPVGDLRGKIGQARKARPDRERERERNTRLRTEKSHLHVPHASPPCLCLSLLLRSFVGIKSDAEIRSGDSQGLGPLSFSAAPEPPPLLAFPALAPPLLWISVSLLLLRLVSRFASRHGLLPTRYPRYHQSQGSEM